MLAAMAERSRAALAASRFVALAGLVFLMEFNPPYSSCSQAIASDGADKTKSRRKKKRHDDDEEETEEERRDRRVREAMRRQDEEDARIAAVMALDERARPYNALGTSSLAPTEEEMEAYRRRQINTDDPMRAFLGKP